MKLGEEFESFWKSRLEKESQAVAQSIVKFLQCQFFVTSDLRRSPDDFKTLERVFEQFGNYEAM